MTRIEIVRPTYRSALQAKEVAMTCDLCGKVAFGPRDQMQAAIQEHQRSSCTAGGTDQKRVYRLDYPRT